MGADITVNDHVAVIRGVEKLHNASMEAPDLRGGASLVIAALDVYKRQGLEFNHKSVLFEESMRLLSIRPDGIYVDGTCLLYTSCPFG